MQDNFASFKLIKKILNLRNTTRPLSGGQHKLHPQQQQIAIDGIWVNYFVESGCVCITEIKSNPDAKKSKELAGLHHVVLDDGSWAIRKKYIKKIETEFAAVNGQSNDRDKASVKIMPRQLLNAYKGTNISEFTLFHNPTVSGLADTYESFRDKMGLTTPMTKQFAKQLRDCQQRGHEVKWVTHSQGGAIFSQAVYYHNKKHGGLLDKHTVYFQAMANNMLVSKRILKKAGVKLHKQGMNNSPIDAVPQVIGLNSVTDLLMRPGLKMAGRLSLAPIAATWGLASAAVMGEKLSTHTRPYQGLKNYGKQATSGIHDMLPRWIQRLV